MSPDQIQDPHLSRNSNIRTSSDPCPLVDIGRSTDIKVDDASLQPICDTLFPLPRSCFWVLLILFIISFFSFWASTCCVRWRLFMSLFPSRLVWSPALMCYACVSPISLCSPPVCTSMSRLQALIPRVLLCFWAWTLTSPSCLFPVTEWSWNWWLTSSLACP